MYDLIIIGGGPAGLTAAVYALRKRLNVLLVSRDLGGKTNYSLDLPWIHEYQVIRGLEIVNKFKSELEYLEFARAMKTVECIERDGETFVVKTREGDELRARAVIAATGVRQQRMNVPGEKEFMMKGMCYSALSYAPLFIDKKSLVVGDGDLAFRAAAELATVASHVTLIRKATEPSASPLYAKLKGAKNVTLMEGYEVVEVKGDTYARSMVVKGGDGATSEVEFDGSFVELGLTPQTQAFAGVVEMDELGRIKVDNAARTSVPGIFAAGDSTAGQAEQVLIAVGEGAKAALSAYEYLLPKL